MHLLHVSKPLETRQRQDICLAKVSPSIIESVQPLKLKMSGQQAQEIVVAFQRYITRCCRVCNCVFRGGPENVCIIQLNQPNQTTKKADHNT